MSKYTTEVRYICEINSGLKESAGDSSVNKILESSAPKVFDFDFPIFDEDYRLPLEIKILKHFYTREIGFETVGLWKLWMDKRLNEIMPYYNQLYLSTLKEFNPFYDVDLTTESKRNINHDETGTSKNKQDTKGNVENSTDATRTDDLRDTSTRTDDLHNSSVRTDDLHDSRNTSREQTNSENHEEHSTGSSNSKTYQLYSDTPQNMLSGVDNENYLTQATKTTVDGSTKDDSNGSSNGINNSKDTSTGTNTGTVTNESSDTGSVTTNGSNTGTVKNTGTASTDSSETVNSDGSTSRKYDNVDSYLEHVQGKRGGASYSELLLQYRKTFLNIDMMIIDDLSDLFMNVW